jgi:hypothetical protein
MTAKKEAGLLAQTEPQPKETKASIDPAPDTVNALRELRLGREIPVSRMVQVVQKRYPRYDKHIQSKAERSHLYGITLCEDAMDALIKVFAPEEVKKPRAENRVNPCRLVCRVSVRDYNLLMDRMREEGFSTTQDWLYSQIKKYLTEKGEYQ